MSVARRPPSPDPDAPHRRASLVLFLAWIGLTVTVIAVGVLVWIMAGA